MGVRINNYTLDISGLTFASVTSRMLLFWVRNPDDLGLTHIIFSVDDAGATGACMRAIGIGSNQRVRGQYLKEAGYNNDMEFSGDVYSSTWKPAATFTVFDPGVNVETRAAVGAATANMGATVETNNIVRQNTSSAYTHIQLGEATQANLEIGEILSLVNLTAVEAEAAWDAFKAGGLPETILPAKTEFYATLDGIGSGALTAVGLSGSPVFSKTGAGTLAASGSHPLVRTPPSPVITGPSGAAGAGSSSKSVAEGVTAVHTFTADVAVSWSKNGGADEADFTINSSTGALDFAPAPDFEAAGDSDTNNTYVVVVRATATVGGATADQTVTVTVTNLSEPPLAPTIGTATAGNASASVAFTPPSNTGRPAISGYTATSSPGGITGTGATSPITVSGLTNGTAYTFTVTAANADGTGPASAASNSVTPSAGDVTPPTMSAASVTGGTLSATGSITASEAGTLWWKMDGSATAADPGPGSEAGAGWTSQSMLAAANSVNFSTQPAGLRYGHFLGIDAAGNRAAVVNASGTVNGAALAGFDFHTAVGCVFGSVSGSLVSLGRETAGRQINVYAKTVGTDTTVAYSAALTLDSNGRLPRWTHASLVLGTQYDLFFCPVDGGKPGVRRMAAT